VPVLSSVLLLLFTSVLVLPSAVSFLLRTLVPVLSDVLYGSSGDGKRTEQQTAAKKSTVLYYCSNKGDRLQKKRDISPKINKT
jgi:hypothetical protein